MDWEGTSLLYVRLFFSVLAGYALFGNYDKKLQLTVALAVFALMMTLAFGGFSDFETVRIPGVLQRIAVVYLVISLLYHTTSLQTQIFIGIALLLLYWALMTLVPVPGFGSANLEKGTNLAAWLDNLLLPNHLWITSKTWDPEGILSTIPAIVTGIIGLWVGSVLISTKTQEDKFKTILLASAIGIIAGWIFGLFFPINKALWTSSYVLFAGGWAMFALAILYYIIDIKEWKKFTQPFIAFGVNPMIVFFLSGIIPRAWNVFKISDPAAPLQTIGMKEYWYKYCLSPIFESPFNSSLADALLYLLFWYIVVSILLWRRIMIKV